VKIFALGRRLIAAISGLISKRHLSFDTLSHDEKHVWKIVRLFIPQRQRWFFEGCRSVPGQLWYADRKALYEVVRRERPHTAFEVGTWRGGGSTLFISQGLYENRVGCLHTIDINSELVESAHQSYRRHLPELLDYVQFHAGSSTSVYPAILNHTGVVNLLFLDGKEDAMQTYQEFLMFEPFLTSNSVMVAHDWETDKAITVRRHLEADNNWEILRVVSPPLSVGLAIAKRR
jgi:predicted O-methyltransferase YrrM